MKNPRLKVIKLPGKMPLVIKQEAGGGFFLTSRDSIIIDISGLSMIIKFLIDNGIMSPKVLEGILEEYHSDGGVKTYVDK